MNLFFLHARSSRTGTRGDKIISILYFCVLVYIIQVCAVGVLCE